MRLENKVALITGAASGFGQAGAELFAQEGAKLVIADIDKAGAEKTADKIRTAGGEATAVHVDVSKLADNQRAVDTALKTYGGLDVLWANAGMAQSFRPITEIDPDLFDTLMGVNARGPWLAARAAVDSLRERGGGAIVITASLSGLKARPDVSAYAASKGAAVMLVRALSREFASDNIRVNGVCPLASQTPMWEQFMDGYADPEEAADTFASAVPMGQLLKTDDVAYAALYLASEEAGPVTGVNLPVDGGSLA